MGTTDSGSIHITNQNMTHHRKHRQQQQLQFVHFQLWGGLRAVFLSCYAAASAAAPASAATALSVRRHHADVVRPENSRRPKYTTCWPHTATLLLPLLPRCGGVQIIA